MSVFCLGCPSFQQRSRKVLLVCFGISPGSQFLHAQQFLIEAMHGSWLFLGKMSPPKNRPVEHWMALTKSVKSGSMQHECSKVSDVTIKT